jgi:hypothetical protein
VLANHRNLASCLGMCAAVSPLLHTYSWCGA